MYLIKKNDPDSSLNIKTQFFTPPGGKNVLPEDHLFVTFLKKSLRHHCRQNGIKRLSPSLIENTSLFEKVLGKKFVEKNFFQLVQSEDKKKAISLAINGTAPILRNYIENKFYDKPQPVELYYFEPFFQLKGENLIEKYLFGIDILGERDSILDVQVINILIKVLTDVQIINDTELQVNCVGCPTCQEDYQTVLQNYYAGKERFLCENCKNNLKENPTALLTCSQEDCQILATNTPSNKDYICAECKDFYQLFKEYLEILKIEFVEKDDLVGQFNYFTPLVYQIVDTQSKQNDVLAHGGRYD